MPDLNMKVAHTQDIVYGSLNSPNTRPNYCCQKVYDNWNLIDTSEYKSKIVKKQAKRCLRG